MHESIDISSTVLSTSTNPKKSHLISSRLYTFSRCSESSPQFKILLSFFPFLPLDSNLVPPILLSSQDKISKTLRPHSHSVSGFGYDMYAIHCLPSFLSCAQFTHVSSKTKNRRSRGGGGQGSGFRVD